MVSCTSQLCSNEPLCGRSQSDLSGWAGLGVSGDWERPEHGLNQSVHSGSCAGSRLISPPRLLRASSRSSLPQPCSPSLPDSQVLPRPWFSAQTQSSLAPSSEPLCLLPFCLECSFCRGSPDVCSHFIQTSVQMSPTCHPIKNTTQTTRTTFPRLPLACTGPHSRSVHGACEHRHALYSHWLCVSLLAPIQ